MGPLREGRIKGWNLTAEVECTVMRRIGRNPVASVQVTKSRCFRYGVGMGRFVWEGGVAGVAMAMFSWLVVAALSLLGWNNSTTMRIQLGKPVD